MKALAADTGRRASKDARAGRAGGAPSIRMPVRGKEAVKSGSGSVAISATKDSPRRNTVTTASAPSRGTRTRKEPIALSSI